MPRCSRVPCRGALACPPLHLLQHQLKAALVLLDVQMLGEIPIIGRGGLGYQPR